MINRLSNKKKIGFCYRWCCIALMAYAVNAAGSPDGSTMKAGLIGARFDGAGVEEIVTRLIDEGFRQKVASDVMPELVWKNLGEHLEAAGISFAGLLSSLDEGNGSQPYHREVIFRSKDYPGLHNKTVQFAIVAIVLSPGQETVTHDHFVECGPLLVEGEITEVYGYTDQLAITGTRVAILDKRRKLRKFLPIQYFRPDQKNTHRLQEGTGNRPSIVLNLYVESEGNSIKNRFLKLLGIDRESGAEWWLQ
ncbi:hypothetical protein [Endozoicomonas sp.]|uniref:hypothetical protein n=1 Tax=Endozoicomonas sp. TaxID=1892382 RepID=UPI0028873E79|nr:hypothetical protein [Endozoicomonas sp.]